MRKASLRSALDLQKKRTIFKELEDGDIEVSLALDFDKGHLNDYRLGSAHLKGQLMLNMTLRQLPKISKSILAETDEFLIGWAVEKGIVDEDSPHFETFSKNPSALAMYLAPMLKHGSQELKIFLKFIACNTCMDDYLDEAVSNASTVSTENLRIFKNTVKLILSGKYTSLGEIELLEVPFFNAACIGLFEIFEELKELIPNYVNCCNYFVNSVTDWLDSISLFAGLLSKNWLGDMSYMTVKRENGQRVLFELICMLNRIFPDDNTRKILPFKLFYDSGDYVIGLTNDIFTLAMDLETGEVSSNMILRKCVLKEMPLQMAVDLCRDMINDAVNDMNQAAKDLIQLSPGNETLKVFIRDYNSFVDGNLLLYADLCDRYGECKYSFKKVLFEDCLF